MAHSLSSRAPVLRTPPHGGQIACLPPEPSAAGADKGGIVWLPGYGSTMEGDKINAIAAWAQTRDIPLTRFDYQGCGASPGEFAQASFGLWLQDSAFMLQQTSGKQVLIGSSMGAWIALHLALRWPERVQALLLLAPAPDFSHRLIWQNADNDQLEQLSREGRLVLPGGLPMTRHFMLEARDHLLLHRPIILRCPVHMLLGAQDDAVPLAHVLKLSARLIAPMISLEVIDADHRFSSAAARALLLRRLGALVASSVKQARSPSR